MCACGDAAQVDVFQEEARLSARRQDQVPHPISLCARLADLLEGGVETVRRGQASLVVAQQCRRGDALLAEGQIRIGCVDAGSFRPRRIPKTILERLA